MMRKNTSQVSIFVSKIKCLFFLHTLQVDVENPDLARFPDFSQLECEDFVMEAGDCLFIPRGYFHHIRSLQKSISVSIWFWNLKIFSYYLVPFILWVLLRRRINKMRKMSCIYNKNTLKPLMALPLIIPLPLITHPWGDAKNISPGVQLEVFKGIIVEKR